MEELLQQVDLYKKEIENFIGENDDAAEVFRIKFLGTKGIVKHLMQEMKNVPNEKKKEAGQLLNSLKQTAEEKYNLLKEQGTGNKQQATDDIDYSLPGDEINIGTRHPLSLVRNRIVSIFNRLGFTLAEGPEIEDDWHNFTSMNMP
ncbi:MAG TPA: phenylalanine--tRNA ligase subunit alpha, partial [Parafilimonas sp.]|nr:phenylalanine--tRNA ligase subunit alpha [Parafilimonas sp.]